MRTCRLWKKFGEQVESAGKPACKPLPFVRGSYARHAVLESLHAGSGKECGELRCSAAKPALLDPLCDVLVISIQQDT